MKACRRLAMALLCRNERDIIATNIRFHARAGVDEFFVMDNGSTDGTLEILEGLRTEVDLTIVEEPMHTIDQDLWMTRLAFMARQRKSAEFIILNDADEFWSHVTDNLKSEIRPEDDVIVTPRRNMIWRACDQFWEDLTLRTGDQDRLRGLEAGPTGVVPTGPKVICRLEGLEAIFMGNHGVTHREGRHRVADDILIRHYPMRSWPQFQSKVRGYGSALLNNDRLPPPISAHLRQWYVDWREGRLASVFDDRIVKDDLARQLVAAGALVDDVAAPLCLQGLAHDA